MTWDLEKNLLFKYNKQGAYMPTNRQQAYTNAGVNINAGNHLVNKIKSIVPTTYIDGVISDIGGFGGLFMPNLKDIKCPVLVSSTDGVGTKLKLAFQFNKHDTVGIDLVAMSVNDILVQGATPLFFLDYFATGKLDTNIAEIVIKGVVDGCKLAKCALLGGETAEMPTMYADGEYDLAGFCVGIVDKEKIIDGSKIKIGDSIIGIASSGLHSNGYSLARKILYNSNLKAEDNFPNYKNKLVKNIILEPTYIYVECILSLMQKTTINGMVHITGGGFYDNIPRVLPKNTQANIDFDKWEKPYIFEWLKKEGNLNWEEILQIFNCGIGYIVILPDDEADKAIDIIKSYNFNAYNIGTIVSLDNCEEQVKINF